MAAGVPYVALPPPGGDQRAPVVLVWHMMDPPRTEAAMAAALPLAAVPAWRVYLGLLLFGGRTPEGGPEERSCAAAPATTSCWSTANTTTPRPSTRRSWHCGDAFAAHSADPARVRLVTVPEMGHELAEEPGVTPAPQTAHAARVDAEAGDWLRRHLPG